MSQVTLAIYRKGINIPETMEVEYDEGVRFRDEVMAMHSVAAVSVVVETELGVSTITVRPEDVSVIILMFL